MKYVVAGYTIVLSILFLYAVALVWRRRKLNRAVERVVRFGEQAGEAGGTSGVPVAAFSTGSRPVDVEPAPVDPR